MAGKKRAGGKPCPAGKVPPKFPDMPLLSAYYANQRLAKARKSPQWQLSNAAVTDRKLLIGSGDIAANVPRTSAAWEKTPQGKRRTRAEKRAAKERQQREKLV